MAELFQFAAPGRNREIILDSFAGGGGASTGIELALGRSPDEARAIGVKRPLADNTMRRIAQGVKRYVMEAANPFIVTCNHSGDGFRGRGLGEPMHTITAARDADGLVLPYIAQIGHTGHGDSGKTKPIDGPLSTMVTKAEHLLVAPKVTAFLSRYHGKSVGGDARAPSPTAEATNTDAVVAAFLAQHNTGMVGHDTRDPVSTIVGKGCTQALVAGHLLHLKGTATAGFDARHPLATIQAEGNHLFAVHSFMVKYYGTAVGCELDAPMHTDTTKPRFGLVTVPALGPDWVLADIGMRMLTVRERFRAQGFPEAYRLDVVVNGKQLSQDALGRMCGNSVCPDLALALAAANAPDMAVSGSRWAAAE